MASTLPDRVAKRCSVNGTSDGWSLADMRGDVRCPGCGRYLKPRHARQAGANDRSGHREGTVLITIPTHNLPRRT